MLNLDYDDLVEECHDEVGEGDDRLVEVDFDDLEADRSDDDEPEGVGSIGWSLIVPTTNLKYLFLFLYF